MLPDVSYNLDFLLQADETLLQKKWVADSRPTLYTNFLLLS